MGIQKKYSKECFVLENSEIEIAITKEGGHMAPVSFFANETNPVKPYYISPWQEEPVEVDVPVLRPLRGDLFCFPFGANPSKDNPYSAHGDTATKEWEDGGITRREDISTIRLEMGLEQGKGKAVKELSIVEGQSVIYCRDTLYGITTAAPLGHHAILGVHDGSLAIRTSPIQFGYTNPYDALYTQGKEYYSLASLQHFDSLEKVPTVWKTPETTDCRVFPAREGYVDILQVFQKRSAAPGWISAVCAGGRYLWFALKNIDVLPSTVFWMENHGRYASPWNGRNVCIGLEDVCAYFANGYSDSIRENILTEKEQVKTAAKLTGKPFSVSYIQGVVRIPEGFDAVSDVIFGEHSITFHAESGKSAAAEVQWDFVFGKNLR